MSSKSNIIAELRREAGYTQKTLAEAMNITDKAISKWERGLSLPDVTLLPKLSALLDADIEMLLQVESPSTQKEWAGLIDLRNYENDLAQIVYDKPMVYYILSHFLLMGVRKIYVLGDPGKQSWLAWDKLTRMGFVFGVNPEELLEENLVIMHRPCFLHGSDLSRRFQAFMTTGKMIKLCPAWDMTPFLFCPAEYAFMYYKNPAYLFENAVLKNLGRGMVCFPLDTPDQVSDVGLFVRMYQQHTGFAIHDLDAIAQMKQQQTDAGEH